MLYVKKCRNELIPYSYLEGFESIFYTAKNLQKIEGGGGNHPHLGIPRVKQGEMALPTKCDQINVFSRQVENT